MRTQKNKKKFPFGIYFDIFYTQRINKSIYKKCFIIDFLRSFALDKKVIDVAIKAIFEKEEASFDINAFKKEDDIPDIFSKYASGERCLSFGLVTACSESKSIPNNVKRIERF